jgi:hypothetical protein
MFAQLISEGIGGEMILASYCKNGVSPSGPCIYIGDLPIGGSCGAGLDPVGGTCSPSGAYPF